MLMPLNVLGAPAAIRPECGLSPAVPLAVRSDPQRSRRHVALGTGALAQVAEGGACGMLLYTVYLWNLSRG